MKNVMTVIRNAQPIAMVFHTCDDLIDYAKTLPASELATARYYELGYYGLYDQTDDFRAAIADELA